MVRFSPACLVISCRSIASDSSAGETASAQATDRHASVLSAGTQCVAVLSFGGGRGVVTVNLVDPPLKPFTGPVQPDAQVEPVPVLAGFGW